MLALALLLATSPASTTSVARRGTVDLEWTAPVGECPDADAVLDDALALLGDVPPPQNELATRASVETTDTGYTVMLRIGKGERTIDAAECGDVARASALLIAMAIDPTVLSRLPPEPEPQPQPEPEPEPAPELVPVPDPEPQPPEPIDPKPTPRPTPRSRTPMHASVSIGAGVGQFALPRASAALELAFAYSPGPARIELAGSWWTPAERTSPTNPEIGGRFQLGAAIVRGCWVPRFDTIELPLCGALHAGVMAGRGTGFPDASSVRDAWVALGGGPMLLWRPRRTAGRLGVWARVEGLGTLAQPAFATTPSGVLWRAREGALLATVGVELRFWSRP